MGHWAFLWHMAQVIEGSLAELELNVSIQSYECASTWKIKNYIRLGFVNKCASDLLNTQCFLIVFLLFFIQNKLEIYTILYYT